MPRIAMLFLIWNYFLFFLNKTVLAYNDPDAGKNIFQLVRSKGFDLEEFPIITANKYLVKLHHIIPLEKCRGADPRKLVVFGIPLFGVSDIYVMDLRNNSWGLYLADHCFDVWLTNVRGDRHGMQYANGTIASAFDKEFFDYTLVDIAVEDLTVQLDFVLKKTGQSQAFFFGMSQGATSFYAMLSKLPDYNSKIRAMVSLGGLRSMCSMKLSALRAAKALGHAYLRNLGSSFFVHGMNGHGGIDVFSSPLCFRSPQFCFFLSLFMIFKPDNGLYVNRTRIAIYLEHFPDGSSIKNLLYFSQLADSCGIVRDYDEDLFEDKTLIAKDPERYSKNYKKYGTLMPPELNSSNIKVPVKLYYSDGDDLATTEENKWMKKTLPGFAGEYRIKDRAFSHNSFLLVPYNYKLLNDVRLFYESYLE